ncbi:MAG: hypothetical protein R2741_07340 [Methanolobus sp.]
MKKLIIIMMLLLTLFMPLASADVVSDLEVKVNEYNENADQLPSFLKSILGDEVIKLVITANDGSEIYIKAVTEDAYVTSFEVVDADTEIGETILIETNEATVQEIMNSEDPITSFLDAMDSGDLVIEPVGIMNNITFTVANIVLKFSQILGLA